MSSEMEQVTFTSEPEDCPERDVGLVGDGKTIFSACVAPFDFGRLLAATKRTVKSDNGYAGNGYDFIRLEFNDDEGTVTAVSLDGYRVCTLKVWLPGQITSETKDMHVYLRTDLPKPNKKTVSMIGISVVESVTGMGRVERTAYVKYGDNSFGFKQPTDPNWSVDWHKTIADAIEIEPLASVTLNAAYLHGVLSARLDADRGVVPVPYVTIELRGETKPVLIYGSLPSEAVSMILPVRKSYNKESRQGGPADVMAPRDGVDIKNEGDGKSETVS